MFERNQTSLTDSSDNWMITSITLRTEEQFLTTPWLKGLSRFLELSCNDLPNGRSWKTKLNNFKDSNQADEAESCFLDTIRLCATLLGREFSKVASSSDKSKQVSSAAIEATINILDPN